jgi:hypothetical protein
MAEHEFSDDPATPLNRKLEEIKGALAGCPICYVDIGKIRDICREIYKMGFDDGKTYVWKLRQL